MGEVSLYFTSNQDSTMEYLNTSQNPCEMIFSWGQRLRTAMGEKEILSQNCFRGGEFRPPTFRSYARSLDTSLWTCYDHNNERVLYVVPYNHIYDGWLDHGYPPSIRHGFMAAAVNAYEYAYDLWDQWTKDCYPDLLDNATFGVWFELLPEPASIILQDKKATLTWNTQETRVHRAQEMGRYCLPLEACHVSVIASHWRAARAEAYVRAWEKMAANEPTDRYESIILAEQEEIDRKRR